MKSIESIVAMLLIFIGITGQCAEPNPQIAPISPIEATQQEGLRESAKSADQSLSVASVSSVAELSASSTVLITSEAQLRAAAWQSRLGDINLIFDSTITVTGTVTFPQSQSIVRLIGTSPQAGLNFAMRFDGDWAALKPANGLELRCRQAIVHGMRVTGYEFAGSVLKAHGCELLTVSDCIFAKIGTIQYPHRVTPPLTAADTIYNACINAQSMPGCIVIVNNRFNRCIHNNHRWSHVLYVSGESVLVHGNTFDDCGNVWGVGGKVLGASNSIFANVITRPHPQLHPTAGRELPPYLAGVGNDNFAFAFNQIAGDHYRPWTGQPSDQSRAREEAEDQSRAGDQADPTAEQPNSPTVSALHLIDFNDYSAMRYSGQWAANTAQGVYILWPQWLQMGFDQHSKPPTDLGVRMPE